MVLGDFGWFLAEIKRISNWQSNFGLPIKRCYLSLVKDKQYYVALAILLQVYFKNDQLKAFFLPGVNV